MRTTTLCFLLRGAPPEVLLGYKKRGFGAGKFAGIGGQVETGETIRAAACREVFEETSIRVHAHDLRALGTVLFCFPTQPLWDQTVHIFTVTRWRGQAKESAEMRPLWQRVDALPFEQMWDDSRYWLPRILSGHSIQAAFTFADDNATVCVAQITPAT